MRALLIVTLLLSACTWNRTDKGKHEMTYSAQEVLEQLDLAFQGKLSDYFPAGGNNDVRYNFFLDLEHGYCETAGSKIHLYGDATRWAIVFEKSGYQNRGFAAEIELNYVGNCTRYSVEQAAGRNYITNSRRVNLIDANEYERIRNKTGGEMEQFELISAGAVTVNVRNTQVKIEHDPAKYRAAGIQLRDFDNPNHLVDYSSLLRYLLASNPALVGATENDIKQQLPSDLPKLLTIDSFHFESTYDKASPPSAQETYQLLAKVLVNQSPALWQPKEKPNNDWRNWESGNL
ncbi:hypothetical protein LJ737_13420 [Hymenobacter sp. 15J16-1T3B]|uniref:DUF7003 family protein n=1 Tax=Hymenobacter sp. 15J16-1T3B TaxID=2886941 RepID=UPI001D10D2D3|nr:hypothetical protein [Hymenobacter sp. 15J16-1T3B]MCC3158242.1 hypothetical protein [Hymenobacter sp. 15J16-1T3B]